MECVLAACYGRRIRSRGPAAVSQIPQGEGWHRVQEVLEAPRAQAQLAEDVALAQLADKPAFGPDAGPARGRGRRRAGLEDAF